MYYIIVYCIINVGGQAGAKQTADKTVHKLWTPGLAAIQAFGIWYSRPFLFHDHSCCSYAGRYSPKWPFRWHICLWVILDHQCGLARHSSPWQSGNHMNAVLLIRRKWQLKQGSSWFYHQPITYIVIYWGGRAIHNLTHGSHNKHEILWHNTGQMSLSVSFYEHMSRNSHLNCIKRRPIQSLLWLRITLRFWQTFSDIQYSKLIAAYKHWTLLRFRALSRKSVPPKFIWLWMES